MKRKPLHIHLLSCADVYSHLCDNLDAKLDSESCRRIKAHIMECKHCSALLDSLKKTIYLYRHYQPPKFSAKAKKQLFAVIRVGKGKKKALHR